MARLLTFIDWESIRVSSNRVRNVVLDWIQGLIVHAGPVKVYLPYILSTDRRVLFVEPDPIWFNFLERRSDNQTVLTDYSVDSWRVDDDPLHLYDFNESQIHFAYPNILEAMEKMILSGQQDDYVILWVTTSSDTRMLEAMGSYHAKAVKVVIGIEGPDKGYEEVFREAQDPENWIGYKGEKSEYIPIEPQKRTAPVDKSVEGLYNVLTNINDCAIHRRCEDLLQLEQGLDNHLISFTIEDGAMSLSLNEEGRNMIKLIEWCGQSDKLRIVCMDEGWDRILQEDGLDASVQRVRACLEFDYIRPNIYLNNKQRKVIRGFLEELDTKDPKLMYEALMISAQGIDGLREAYDYLSNVGLISMPFERYQELSMPLVKTIYYMLGPTLEREDPKDELTYHESVRTSIRNAIIVSEWGSILSDMRDSFIADIARPHMEDTGCMIRSILVSWEKKNRRQYSICSSEIIDLIILLQEMGVDRDQQYVEWTMSVIKSEKNPTERYLQLKKMGLIPEGFEEDRFTELSNPIHALFRRRK